MIVSRASRGLEPNLPALHALETLQQRIQELERRVAALEQQQSARHACLPNRAADLLATLAASLGGFCFTSVDVLRHAQHDPALHAALARARCLTPRRLGARLHTLERSDAGAAIGLRLERIGTERHYVVYSVTHSTPRSACEPADAGRE